MSRLRRRTHMSMATIITNMGIARTIIPITATRITGTAIIKTSAPRRMCTGRNAATIITTMASPTTIPTRLMDAQSLKPESLGLGSPRKEDPKLGSFAELALLLWLSPAFPVGAFAYSHGLEWAVESGDIKDAASLIVWLEALCDAGAPRNDAVLFAAAHRAAAIGDWSRLAEINELAVALAN